MLSLGYSEYVCQGGDWGHFVRFQALLIQPDDLTILLVDTGVGISVRAPARQGFPYQLSFVGWFSLFTFSYHFDLSPIAQCRPDFILAKSNTIY